MSDSYLYTVSNHVATFSINDAPYNLMSLEYIDHLEEQLPEGMKRSGGPEAFFRQRHRVLDMIEHGGKPAIATPG